MNYFNDTIRIIDNSIQTIDEKKFVQLLEESISTLQNDKKIIVSGLGKNVPICEKFVGTLLSLGLNAYFLHTNSAVHGDIGIVKEGDLVIILTKSGETVESIYLSRKLKERNANMWLITFELESTLTNEIQKHIVIHLEHEGDMWNIMPNNSTTLNLIILQTLAMNIANELHIGIDEFKKNHPGGHIGELLKVSEYE